MRIARVESATDRAQAHATFERGLEEARRLTGRDRDWLLEQARILAAAAAPDLVASIPSGPDSLRHMEADRICQTMLGHNHRDAAYEYVMHYDGPDGFPFGGTTSLMQHCDDGHRGALLRRAAEAWWPGDTRQRSGFAFISVFQLGWKSLPAAEAREVVRKLVRTVLQRPDSPITATYGSPDEPVTITSTRQHTLFQILSVLRQLDPELAESLIGNNSQLSAAARRYPNGMDTIREAAAAQSRAAGASGGGGYVMAGRPGDFDYLHALMEASQTGEFSVAIEQALESYRHDIAPESPNQAPREFWPSTGRFRSILSKAGTRLGRAGAAYLDRIPDGDLRLFAAIEFEAALAGLPELQGTQREYRPRGAAG